MKLHFILAVGSGIVVSCSSAPLERQPLTLELYNNLKHYAQYLPASYCDSGAPSGTLLSCMENQCPTLERNNVSVVAPFKGGLAGLVGFVAADHVRREIVVVFRGSASIPNIIADAVLLMTACPFGGPDCRMHAGFAKAWSEVKPTVRRLAQEAAAQNPGYGLVFTGHSLGGVAAQLAALDLRREGGPFAGAAQYNYGSPRIGNDAFVRYQEAQEPSRDYRVTHYQDLATTYVPLAAGFRHPFPEYWLRDGPATRTDYAIGDIQVCTGTEQQQCSETRVNLSLNSHMHYFQQLWPCYRITAR